MCWGGAGIRGGGQDTWRRQGRQEEVSGWSYRQRKYAAWAREQTASLDPEKHVVPLRFGGGGRGVVFVLTGSHSAP